MKSSSNARDQWLAERQHGIGASEVPTVFGLNPYCTPLELYLRKRGEAPAVEQTQIMEAGHRMEPVIAKWYEDETGRETVDLGEYTIQRMPGLDWMTCTLDRQVMPFNGHDMPGTLQIKNVTAWKASDWDEQIPLHVQIQVQAEMAVCGMDWGSVAALIGGNRFVWQDVEKNERFADEMIERCAKFWDQVKNGNPPEATGADVDLLAKVWPEHVPEKVVELPLEAGDWRDELESLEVEGKSLEKTINEYKARIKQALGDAEKGVLPDGSGWTWKTQQRKEKLIPAGQSRVLRRFKAKGA